MNNVKKLLSDLNYRFQVFMQGRYGFDKLSRTLIIVCLICFLLSRLPYMSIFYSIGLISLILSFIRCFSRNTQARYKELMAYYRLKNKLNQKFTLLKQIYSERNTHRYFRCKGCHAVLRVPKGKGKIEITCRTCKKTMIKKT